ncbi:MAG: hypothetical protein R3C61_16315 [Bacteroidia bacterium]
MKIKILFLFFLLFAGVTGFAQTASDWPFNSQAQVPLWLKNPKNPYETTGQMIIGASEFASHPLSVSRGISAEQVADMYFTRTQTSTGDNTLLAGRLAMAQPSGFDTFLRNEGYSAKAVDYYQKINAAGSQTNLRQTISSIMKVEGQILADPSLTNGEQMMLLATASSARYIEFYTAGISSGLSASGDAQTYNTLSLPDNNGDGVIDDNDALVPIPPSPSYPKLVSLFKRLKGLDGGYEPGTGSKPGGPPYLPVLPACGLNCNDK